MPSVGTAGRGGRTSRSIGRVPRAAAARVSRLPVRRSRGCASTQSVAISGHQGGHHRLPIRRSRGSHTERYATTHQGHQWPISEAGTRRGMQLQTRAEVIPNMEVTPRKSFQIWKPIKKRRSIHSYPQWPMTATQCQFKAHSVPPTCRRRCPEGTSRARRVSVAASKAGRSGL